MMKTFLHELLLAPLEAIRDLRVRLNGYTESSHADNSGKLIIDRDGNPRLNLHNEEVIAELQQHIDDLALIRVPVEVSRPSSRLL